METSRRVTAASAAGRMNCQLQCAPSAVGPFRADEIALMRLDRRLRRVLLAARHVIAEPGLLVRKARALARRSHHAREAVTASTSRTTAPIPRRHSPPLAPGDRVRVRTRAEIDSTLDAAGACDGMAFLDVVMERYCGRTFTVRRRIDRFFDERNWRMLKLRDAVILDGSYCEPAKSAGVDWAGCDRSCFLFWKEAWLERVAPGASGDR